MWDNPKYVSCGDGFGKWYLRVHVRSQLIHDGLGAVVEELIRVGDVVDVDPYHGRHRGLRPPPKGLRPLS